MHLGTVERDHDPGDALAGAGGSGDDERGVAHGGLIGRVAEADGQRLDPLGCACPGGDGGHAPVLELAVLGLEGEPEDAAQDAVGVQSQGRPRGERGVVADDDLVLAGVDGDGHRGQVGLGDARARDDNPRVALALDRIDEEQTRGDREVEIAFPATGQERGQGRGELGRDRRGQRRPGGGYGRLGLGGRRPRGSRRHRGLADPVERRRRYRLATASHPLELDGAVLVLGGEAERPAQHRVAPQRQPHRRGQRCHEAQGELTVTLFHDAGQAVEVEAGGPVVELGDPGVVLAAHAVHDERAVGEGELDLARPPADEPGRVVRLQRDGGLGPDRLGQGGTATQQHGQQQGPATAAA